MGDLTENFSKFEFQCRCGCGLNSMDMHFMSKLQFMRERLGKAITPTSGIRCLKHNKIVGGAITSAHLDGEAADLEAIGSRARYELIDAAISEGFTRIGIGKTFIHMDSSRNKDQCVIWLY